MNKTVTILAAALVLAASGCEDEKPLVVASEPPRVPVTQPVVQRVTDREDFTGRTDAIYSVDVVAQVSGYLDKVLFQDGAEVKKGDVLFQIDPRPYEAEVARTRAAVAGADAHRKRLEADFKRAKNLFDRGVIGRQEFDLVSGDRDEAKAALDSAQEQLNLAELDLEWTKVTARISGLISRRMVDPGALVKAGETIMTNIVTQDPLYIYFDLDESTLLRLRRLIRDGAIQSSDGKDVSAFVGLADQEDFPLRAVIDFSENKTDPNTGTLRVRGTIRNPKPYMLNPGMFVNVRLPVGAPHQVVLIPDQAIGTDQGRKFVYVVDEHNEIAYRRITIGFAEPPLRVVDEGLQPTDRVIVSGIQRLRPGLKVVPVLETEREAKARVSDTIDQPARALETQLSHRD